MSVKRPDPVDVVVGTRIRALRNMRGMSQTKLADSLGLTFQQVQKYEKGVNRVGAGRLTKIAEVLQVPVVELFQGHDGSNNAPIDDPMVNLGQTRRGIRVARAFNRISNPAIAEQVVALVEAMADPQALQQVA